MFEKIICIVYVAYLVIMSITAFVAFKNDKQKAIKGQERTKEKTLLELTVLGGSLGAFIGRIVCRHKTDKKYFSMTIYLSMLLQAVVLVLMIVQMVQSL